MDKNHNSAKRIKNAYRKYSKGSPKPLSLKAWSKSFLADDLKDELETWTLGKSQAVMCKQREDTKSKKKK